MKLIVQSMKLLFCFLLSFIVMVYDPHRILVLDCHSVFPAPHIRCFQLHQEEGPRHQDIQNPVLGYGIGVK